MVALSDVDKNKIRKALEYIHNKPIGGDTISPPDELSAEMSSKKIRQIQKRLSKEEINKIILGYSAGETIYQLAERFSCHRTTVSQHLRAQGIEMRRKIPCD